MPSLRAFGWLRWLGAAAVLAYGLANEDWQSAPWAAVTVLVFGAPLALQFARAGAWRAYGLWFGLFIVAQALLTPLVLGHHVALPANMRATVDVRTDSIPGHPRGVRQVSTDERGWRVWPPVDYAAKAALRIVAIGGSTTEDIALDDRATWTHRLQQDLARERSDGPGGPGAPGAPGVQVINTGASGLRAVNHRATLGIVAALHPDLVLILLGANDWNKHIRDHFEPGRERFAQRPFRLTALPRVISGVLAPVLRRGAGAPDWANQTLVINAPEDMNNRRRTFLERHPLHRWAPEAVAPAYQAELQAMDELCRRHQLRCMWMSQPHVYGPPAPPPEMVQRLWMTPPYEPYGLELASMAQIAKLYNDHLGAFARNAGQPFCDLAAGMKAERVNYYDDMHYTDAGAARVAELVAACVRALAPAPAAAALR